MWILLVPAESLQDDPALSGQELGPEDRVVVQPQYIGSVHADGDDYKRVYGLKVQLWYKKTNGLRVVRM